MRIVPALDDVYLGGVSVLVVDDCKLVRGTVAAMLEHYGATVTAVGSADEALEALVRERPDVLVSDLAMPGKGGTGSSGRFAPWGPSAAARRPRPPSPDSPVRSTAPVSCAQGSSTTSRSRSLWRNWPGSSGSSP
jgi:hypothetical protein